MRKLTFVSIFVLCLSGPLMQQPTYAKHVLWHCCSCGMCDSTCYCKYQTPYCFCTVPDDEGIHPDHHMKETTVQIRPMREFRAFNVAESNISERLKTLMASQSAQRQFTLKVLDQFENGIKMWCPGSEGASAGNLVAVAHR